MTEPKKLSPPRNDISKEKSPGGKKIDSDCSFDLSSDEESKKQAAKPKEIKPIVNEEDKYLQQLQNENELLQKQINSVMNSDQIELEAPQPLTQSAVPENEPSLPPPMPITTPPLSNSKRGKKIEIKTDNFLTSSNYSNSAHRTNEKDASSEFKPVPYNDKVKTMEQKIFDSTKTIRRLEKLIKEREDTISDQEKEINKKTKLLNQLESRKDTSTSLQRSTQIHQSINESIKQKESVQEEKLRIQEENITEIKNQIQKAQQNNSSLMEKLKKANELHEQLEKENKTIKQKQVEDESLRGKYVTELDRLNILSKQYTNKEEYLKGEMEAICKKYNDLKSSTCKLLDCSKAVIDMHNHITTMFSDCAVE